VTVAVTGASGFLGRAICRELVRRGHEVRALHRPGARPPADQGVVPWRYHGLHDEPALRLALQGSVAVIHLAARVHQRREQRANLLTRYLQTNSAATERLARIAAETGVCQLLFASSVKAVGESNQEPWTEDTTPAPTDPYGISKLEAERALALVASECGLATTVIRLPLIYGPGVKANMYRLFQLVDRVRFLPFAGIRNTRSLLYVGNAAAAFCGLLGRDGTAHQIYFASDGEDLSTPELIRRIGAALGREPKLLPAPCRILEAMTQRRVPGISSLAQRLAGSLTVDSGRLRNRIGSLPYTVSEGLRETAEWYRVSRSKG
jgi:nucleoside-diphosphate-sugar epimerase